MKKYVKQLKSIIMALTLVFGIAGSSILVQAAPDPTTTIRITGIEEGCNVYAYAVAIDAVDTNGNHYWKYNPTGNVENRVKDGSISAEDAIYFYMNLNSGMSESDWNLHDGAGAAVVDTTVLELTYNATEKSYSASNVKPGLYVIAANKQNMEYSYSPTVVAVNYQYSGTGIASIADENGVINVTVKKSDNPTLKKEVIENNTAQKYGDANIGDVVDFKITLTIPNYSEAWKTENLHYVITDSLSAGLTLHTDSVLIAGTNINEKFSDSNKNSTNTNINVTSNGFKLDLYGEDVYQYLGATIEITYSATVNENAKVNFDEEENKATIQYTTTANGTNLSDPTTDTTYHYTFGFDTLVNGIDSDTTTEITKYGVKTTTETNNKVALDGAEFQMFNADNQKLYFTSDGKYTAEGSGLDHIVSKNNGQLTVRGLDAGTYTLKESKAPYGYALDKTTYTVVITPTYNERTGELLNYTVTVSGGASSAITFTHEKLDNGEIRNTDNAADVDTFGINNTPLLTLPETGGVGIIIVTVVAIAMMAGFGCAFILLRKRKRVE